MKPFYNFLSKISGFYQRNLSSLLAITLSNILIIIGWVAISLISFSIEGIYPGILLIGIILAILSSRGI